MSADIFASSRNFNLQDMIKARARQVFDRGGICSMMTVRNYLFAKTVNKALWESPFSKVPISIICSFQS